MTFLPIVERELRVASRRKFTHWSRLAAAGFMLAIFSVLMILFSSEKGMGAGVSIGVVEFSVLEWAAFIFAGGAGVFLTSDSLSEEKRDGTLGLLFLTDLRGHDVVLGKLMSHSLQAFYGLLAAFPVLALPLLLGGVSGVEFSRAMLVIGNTLFLSLATGLFVSAISREVLKAMNAALFIMLFLLLGLPLLDSWVQYRRSGPFECILSVGSPGFLFTQLKNMRAGDFWFQLGLQNLFAWIFLGAACFCVPRTWQERARVTGGARVSLGQRWRYGGRRARLALRRKLVSEWPVLWLALRDRWLARLIWLVTAIAAVVESYNWLVATPNSYVHIVPSLAGLLQLAFYLWVASQACRFFVDAMRNGALELILVTPVTPRQLAQGQWAALCRTFLLPAVVIIALTIAGEIQSFQAMRKTMAAAKSTPGFDYFGYQIMSMVTGTVKFFFGLAAMGWFGMWMGVTTRKTSIAALKTIGTVLIVPWILEVFAQIVSTMFFASMLVTSNRMPMWMIPILIMVLDTGKNLFFILWSRHMLFTKLRDAVANTGQVSVRSVRPPLPTTVPGATGL